MPPTNRSITLAIETAIGGGSICLFEGTTRVDGLVGPSGVSRAEDLLPNIDKLLISNGLDKWSISHVVVGAGPGSFTGIRIGIATALGLGAALSAPIRKYSTLQAISLAANIPGDVIAALPVGRETVCVQSFKCENGRSVPVSAPMAISKDEFVNLVSVGRPESLVVNRTIYDAAPAEIQTSLIDIGDDFAGYLGRFATVLTEVTEPLFIGKRK